MNIRLIWSNRVYGDDGKSGVYIYTEQMTVDDKSDIAHADGFYGCEKLDGNFIRVICRFQYPSLPENPPWAVGTQVIELSANSPALTKCDYFPELIGIEKIQKESE